MPFQFPQLSVVVPKYVELQDNRLAVLNYAFILGILGWVASTILTNGSYLMVEEPFGTSSIYAEANLAALAASQDSAETPRCADASALYGYSYDAMWTYENVVCAYPDVNEILKKSSVNEMFVTTHEATLYHYRVKAAAAVACPAQLALTYPAGPTVDVALKGYFGGQCRYMSEVSKLHVGVEEVELIVDHAYETSEYVKRRGGLPATHVRIDGSDRDLFFFARGETVRLKLDQILDALGLDLDAPADRQPRKYLLSPNLRGNLSNAAFPMLRLMGVLIEGKLAYFNYNLDRPGSQSGMAGADADVYCILTLSPKMTWTSQGHAPAKLFAETEDQDFRGGSAYIDSYEYGVYFKFQATGKVGSLNRGLLLSSILDGFVLASVCFHVTRLIACYAMGTDKSRVYRSFSVERVNAGRAFAKWSQYALVAASYFQKADQDDSGRISRVELKNQLLRMLKRANLTPDMADILSSYILEEGSRKGRGASEFAQTMLKNSLRGMAGLPPSVSGCGGGGGDGEEEEEEEFISFSDWVELFCDDASTLEALKRVIAEETRTAAGEAEATCAAAGEAITGLLPLRQRARALARQTLDPDSCKHPAASVSPA